MCSLFQFILKSHYPSIYYGYETIYEEERPTREEYDMVFQDCVDEHKELLMDMLRQQRNEILKSTDMYLLSDYPITEEERARVIEYRQKLRDITNGDLPKFSRVDYVLEFDLTDGDPFSKQPEEVVDDVVDEEEEEEELM